jgi:hypothetical protein
MRVLLAMLMVSGLAGVSVGEEAVPPPAAPKAAVKVPASVRLSHHKQVQVSIRFASGLRAIAPYGSDEFCGDVDTSRANGFAAVCTGRTPFSVDFELGYGVARKVDLFLEFRLGLETDFGMSQSDQDGARQFHISPGGRFFFGDAGSSKLFTTAQLVIDKSGYKDFQGGTLSADFGIRNMNGLWFDLDRAYGFYAFVGETATFARWLRFELELGIGISGRYP